MTRKRRKRKTRIGSKLLLALALLLASGTAGGQKTSEVYAVVAGTVFREPGFALPGAEVALEPDKQKPKKVKVRRMKMISDARGEFAFRVPAAPLGYTVSVKAEGFRPDEKRVEIFGEQRVDVYFQLKADTSKQ